MIVRLIAASAVLLALGACSGAAPTDATTSQRTARSSTPTLLVTNGWCLLGPCEPIEMRAFIPQWRVPGQLPTGVPFMGSMSSRVACLRFPAADTLRVIAVDSTGTPIDTSLTIWTADSAVALVAVTSQHVVLLSTAEFVPASSPGWKLTVTNRAAPVAPVPGPACTP